MGRQWMGSRHNVLFRVILVKGDFKSTVHSQETGCTALDSRRPWALIPEADGQLRTLRRSKHGLAGRAPGGRQRRDRGEIARWGRWKQRSL